jgi:3-oxoacyl-[acyl-carrier-protein] synthase-3
MRNAFIAGTGVYVPEKILTNDDLSRILGENINDFVENKVGIIERHIAADDESTADLATKAAKNALRNAGISADEIDLIILATDTPEYLSPATSVIVQQRIGAANAGTFDVNCACAGFVTALDTAYKYVIADKSYKNVLVIGCYAMSKFLDWNDKKTATLFADGAGAVVLKAIEDGDESEAGFLSSKLYANGDYAEFMGIFAGGAKMPVTSEVLAENIWNKLRFANKYPPEVNIEGWQKIVREVLAKADLNLEDVDLFLWTQVNISTIKIVMEAMDIPFEKTHTIMQKWGYTGSACIPMVLHDAIENGKLKRGDVVVLCASGGGLNMAALAFRY